MDVHTNIASLPPFRNPVVTIGTFDGVHLGHRKIIEQLKQEAKKISGETVIITFHPHPRKIVGTDKTAIHLINTPEEKKDLLESLGIDHLVVIPFTEVFANQTATEYIEEFLIKYFHPHTLIIGYDHRFGKGRQGDFHLLEEYSAKLGFHLIEIPERVLDESAISSTRIRENLLTGKLEDANQLLGYSYFFYGNVVEGNKLGRTLGFPTANLHISDHEKLVPSNGVYAVMARIKKVKEGTDPGQAEDRLYRGMMNIGVRPTINGTAQVIEVHLFDFNEDIYGQTLEIHTRKFLRNEEKFNGLEALKKQLEKDQENALQALSDAEKV